MKDQILKLAGVKSEAAFYKKFPSEAAFMKVHGKALKKAAMGASMVKDQLTQLTDFSNPPIAQNGAPIAFGDLTSNVNAANAGMSRSQYDQAQQQQLDAQNAQTAAAGKGGGGDGFTNMMGDAIKMAPQIMEMMGRNGFEIPQAQGGIPIPSGAPSYTPPNFNFDPKFADMSGAVKPMNLKNAGATGFGKGAGAINSAGGVGSTTLGKAGGFMDTLDKGLKKFDKLGGMGMVNDVIGGVKAIKEQKNQINEANQSSQVSGLALKASGTRAEETRRQYVRPEDALVQPEQMFPTYGVGTNVLARNGYVLQDGGPVGGNPTEIQNTYDPNSIYTDLGYEPLSDSDQLKQYVHGGDIPMAKFGDYFADSGQAQIGSVAGKTIGNLILPGIGGMVGGFLGKIGGNLLGGAKDAQELRGFQEDDAENIERTALQQGAQQIQSANSNVMEDGGWVSNDWTPQVITKFGDYDVKDLFQPPHDADMLRAGGHVRGGYTPPSARALQTYAMGGELQVHKGEAEPISTNPYLPDGGETIMFRGPSHANGGMPITYGQSPVEVEGGEPAVKLQDGGTGEDNLVVFGNLQIPNQYLSEIGDPKAKGKKFKNYINDLSKIEARQNKIVDKSTNAILDLDPKNSFEKMKLDSLHANIMGANMKLKDIADKKQNAAAVQSAINDTAEENGLVADDLAKGKVRQAKLGASIRKAQGGDKINKDEVKHLTSKEDYDYLQDLYKQAEASPGKKGPAVEKFQREFSRLAPDVAQSVLQDYAPTQYGKSKGLKNIDLASNYDQIFGKRTKQYMSSLREPIDPVKIAIQPKTIDYTPLTIDPKVRPLGTEAVTTETTKYPWEDRLMDIYNEALPYMRRSDQQPLGSNQLMGEMYALSQNQLEPVSAQRYQPQLQVPYDISFQDQLNANQADFNALQKQTGYNPAAQAALAAQKYMANEKVLGEQFRANQAMKDRVYSGNIATLNDAQLKNLGIFDTQYGRQAQAKSNTKAVTQAALNSISDKIAKNKLENKTLGVYENLYNFRYDDKGRAINKNPLARFSTQASAKSSGRGLAPGKAFTYDDQGNIIGTRSVGKDESTARNGSIVKAMKNL